MKYLRTLFIVAVISVFSPSVFAQEQVLPSFLVEDLVNFVKVPSATAQDSLGSAFGDLKQTCQDYLDSGEYEKSKEVLARQYAYAKTDEERKAVVSAYAELEKMKEVAEAFTAKPTPEQQRILEEAGKELRTMFEG